MSSLSFSAFTMYSLHFVTHSVRGSIRHACMTGSTAPRQTFQSTASQRGDNWRVSWLSSRVVASAQVENTAITLKKAWGTTHQVDGAPFAAVSKRSEVFGMFGLRPVPKNRQARRQEAPRHGSRSSSFNSLLRVEFSPHRD